MDCPNNPRLNILLGITGSVAATTAKHLVEALKAIGDVEVISTEKAKTFTVNPNTQLDPNTKVYTDKDEWGTYTKGDPVLHIELRKRADVLVIAPLSAHTLAKLATGQADNLLTSVARAWDFTKPVIVAPAMNTFMWEHPITEEHLTKIRSWGYAVVQPIEKTLACGDHGIGAMAQITDIASAAKAALQWAHPLPHSNLPTLPTSNHPGAFGVERKYDIHTGIDLYCKEGDPIHAAEAGTVVAVIPFTGPQIQMPWWNNTMAILIENEHHVVLYGECEPEVTTGQTICAGERIGHIIPVLPPHKLREDIPNHSTSMLHLELLKKGSRTGAEWQRNAPKPNNLLDPTNWLSRAGSSLPLKPHAR